MGYQEYIKKTYKDIFSFIKKDILKINIILLIIFIVITISVAITIKTSPEVASGLMEYVSNIYAQKDLVNANGNINFFKLTWNNIFAGFVTTALGIFPYFVGPIVSLILNSGIMGVVIGVTNSTGVNMGLILLSVLPHGIFEIPAFTLSMSLGYYISLSFFRIIFKNKNIKFKKVFTDVTRTFVLVVAPLFIIAAIIESFLIAYLVQLFI